LSVFQSHAVIPAKAGNQAKGGMTVLVLETDCFSVHIKPCPEHVEGLSKHKTDLGNILSIVEFLIR